MRFKREVRRPPRPLFVGFPATMPESDFSWSCIGSYGSSPSCRGPSVPTGVWPTRRPPGFHARSVRTCQGLRPRRIGRMDARTSASARLAFRGTNSVGIRDYGPFAAQWLACTLPCRRFADVLADVCARLVGCYSFIAVDSHHYSLPVSRRTSADQTRSAARRSLSARESAARPS